MVNFLTVLGLALPISCFLDTGSLYINHQVPQHYIVDSKHLLDIVSGECGNIQANKLKIYRAHEVDDSLEGTFIKHVQYDSIENLDDFAQLCQLETDISTVDSVNDIVYGADELVLVQQVPKFQKREVVEEVYDEYSEDMKAVPSMAETGEDMGEQVHILDEEKKQNTSLFNTYQFFTPGIFMCLIVSFFLLFVIIQALSWIGGIEISYQSFEKQVDLEKKNE